MHPTQNQVDADPGTRTDAVTGTPSATPADTLRVAATYLETHGWTRCQFFELTNQLEPAACVVGAIRYAVYGYPQDSLRLDGPLGRHVERAVWAIADSLGVDVLDDLEPWLDCSADAVQAWNDRPDRTAVEVIHALREAAEAYDIEAYSENERDHDRIPTSAGYDAWQRAHAATGSAGTDNPGES